jgi:hypothetical protein
VPVLQTEFSEGVGAFSPDAGEASSDR